MNDRKTTSRPLLLPTAETEVTGGVPRSELKRRQKAYRDLMRVLPAQQREAAKALEKVRPEPDLHIQVFKGFVAPDGTEAGLMALDQRRSLAVLAAALYGRQMEWDPGRMWFEEPTWATMESTHDAIESCIVDLAYSVVLALDEMCHIKRLRFAPPTAGLLRTQPGFSMVPAKRDGLRWCYCIEPPARWGGVYFPWYKTAFRMEPGDIFAVPGAAWPGFAPMLEGYGYFMLSHEPPEHAKRSLIIAKK